MADYLSSNMILALGVGWVEPRNPTHEGIWRLFGHGLKMLLPGLRYRHF